MDGSYVHSDCFIQERAIKMVIGLFTDEKNYITFKGILVLNKHIIFQRRRHCRQC